MSLDDPGFRPEQLARELIDEDLRESTRRTARSGVLARLLTWLREKFSSRAQEPAQRRPDQASYPSYEAGPRSPFPDHNVHQAPRGDDAPLARATELSARRKVADLQAPKLQQVLHATLEYIADTPELRRAYDEGKLPVVEWLLERTAPESTVSRSREEVNEGAVTLVDVKTPAYEEPPDFPPTSPWYRGAQQPATERDFSASTDRSAAFPDDPGQPLEAPLATSPPSDSDAHTTPLNPLVDNGSALEITVEVRRRVPRADAGARPGSQQPARSAQSRGRR